MRYKKRPNKAFSLIELSIVILIIGVLIAGVTSASSVIYNSRVAAARHLTKSAPVNGIKDLVLWLETVSSESFTQDPSYNYDQAISSWNDIGIKSSKTEVTLSDAPSYIRDGIGGLPALRFDRSESNYVIADAVADSVRSEKEMSFFIVATNFNKNNGVHRSNMLLSLHDASGGNVMRFGISPQPAGAIFFSDTDSESISSDTGFHDTAFVYSYVDTDSNSTGELFVNGSAVAIDAAAINAIDYSQVYQFSIAQEYDGTGTSDYFDGIIGEVIVYNRSLRNSERKSIENYLMQKWKIN